MDVVDVDGLQIAYGRVGSGPALVLLHGYVGDGPTTWRPQLDGLSDEFTVVAWDAPGVGRSTDPPERFGTDGYADCLAGFLERLRLDTAYVAGLSFGGIVALALQRRHSARSSALILASAYAGWAGSLPPEVTEGRLRQALALADGAPEAFVGTSRPSRTCCSSRSARPPATSCSRGRAAGRSPNPFLGLRRAAAAFGRGSRTRRRRAASRPRRRAGRGARSPRAPGGRSASRRAGWCKRWVGRRHREEDRDRGSGPGGPARGARP